MTKKKRMLPHEEDKHIRLLELIDLESAQDRNMRITHLEEGVTRVEGVIPMRHVFASTVAAAEGLT